MIFTIDFDCKILFGEKTTGLVPNWFGELRSLTYLDCGGNQFSGSVAYQDLRHDVKIERLHQYVNHNKTNTI